MELLAKLIDPGRSRAIGQRVNDLTERIAGRDRRALYAGEGLPQLPALSRDSLQLEKQATTALRNARVYLLPGAPWPGVAQNGAAWLEPWAEMLTNLGVGRAVPIPYEGRSFIGGTLRILTDPLFNQSEKRVLSQIATDLALNPLKPSEKIFVIGHSYGAKVGVKVADSLKAQGLPIEGMVMLGTRVPDVGQFVKHTPKVRTLLEVENDAGEYLKPQPNTDFRRLMLPQLRHMDLVLNPPANLIDQIMRTLAEVPAKAGRR